MAQSTVNWTYSAKKTCDKTYEVHIVATIGRGWHLYSQTTPEGGPVPTSFTFNKNPLLKLEGGVKEVGKIHVKHEEVFGIDTKFYSDKVVFVQKVSLKNNAKTKLTGTLEYMVCNDTQCLPPTTVNFAVSLN